MNKNASYYFWTGLVFPVMYECLPPAVLLNILIEINTALRRTNILFKKKFIFVSSANLKNKVFSSNELKAMLKNATTQNFSYLLYYN